MIRIRFVLIALAGVALLLAPLPLQAQTARPGTGQSRPVAARPIPDGAIQAIKITGNQRIEDSTIRSYILLQVGDAFDADRADRSLKALYGTGLFQDVKLDRDGGALLIRVQENPLVNRIAFEGNRKLTDAILAPEMKLRSRGVFTTAAAQQDRQRILDLYAAKGRFAARVEPKLIRLEDNRVDVVYEVADGDVTLISRMAIVGNSHFSESKLLEVVNTRESAWWRFLSSSDFYDPDRIAFDKELLRRYYLKNGYVDFQVVDATAELTADRSAFFVTYTLYEGDRYRIGKVSANVTLRNLSNEDVQKNITIDVNDWYNGDTIERATEVLDKAIRARGFTFVEVKPRISRDPIKKTVDLVFDVNEGSRIFVERIDIIGNMRTQDKVIRRQILIAEGDAFDVAKVRRSRQRLSDLGYFEQGTGVTMTPSRGSTQDRTIIHTEVQEKAT
ncbi:MAG: outer membrane protein assembly factor BamA, partial [Acetobacteraceae bacterium]|nr:outer membrane protein assembly factor BamA [Acetobacteraceae bacterium]